MPGEPAATAEQPIIPGASITQVSKLAQLPAGGSLVGVTATCPSDSVVVGGGYVAHPQTRVYRSSKTGNGWSINILNLSTATSSTVNVVAECLKGTTASTTLYAGPMTTIPPGGDKCVVTKCPGGTILTGGGFTGSTPLHAAASTSMADAREWQICGKNQNNFQSTTFTPHALCVSGVSGGAHRAWSGQQPLDPGNERVMQLGCSSGLLMSSGGYTQATFIYARANHRSFQDANLWSTTFVNQGTARGYVGMTATCLELW
jgi:hypothetical protein